MNLTYGLIERRLGTYSYKTAATIFLISRTIGSAFRLYLVLYCNVLYLILRNPIRSHCINFIKYLLHLSRRLKTIIITDFTNIFLVTSVFDYLFYCQSLNLNIIEALKSEK
jgi:hypothetical protein